MPNDRGRRATKAARSVSHSTRPDASSTRDKLLDEARSVFGRLGYDATSVSAICRNAGLAQGTFYRYFANKEDVYLELVRHLQREVIAALQRAAARPAEPRERILRYYRAILRVVEGNVGLYKLFREAEFVSPEIARHFYAAIAEVIAQAVSDAQRQRAVVATDPEVAAYGILALPLFQAVYYRIWRGAAVPRTAIDTAGIVICEGIDSGLPSTTLPGLGKRGRVRSVPPGPRAGPAEGGEATRRALLDAAERLFGEEGFHQTTIAGITYVAGVALGTFYLYFPSKVHIFNALAREISHRFRREGAEFLEGLADRRDVECVGYEFFLRWSSEHRGCYRILREAEFVDEQVGRWHYQRLAQEYEDGLELGVQHGQVKKLPLEAAACALMGIAHLAGQRWVLWQEPSRSYESVLPSLCEFVLHGLHLGM